MGIKDFHQSTNHLLEDVHISKYKGQRIGCDASSWLHRGANPWGWELHAGIEPWKERGGDPPWVDFAMRMVLTVQEAGAIPVVVFDGCRNPAKAVTNLARAKSKAERLCEAEELMVAGQQEEAMKKFKQTVNVTPEMAYQLMRKLREASVEFMVAPYEADAQLAYLQSVITVEHGGVSAVITEDSDLVAFGATRILFKCTQDGYAKEFSAERAFAMDKSQLCAKGHVNFAGWNKEMVQLTCVLSGCDYLPSLRGIGFKTAYKMVSFRKEMDGVVREIKGCNRWSKEEVEEYVRKLHAAILAFKHALVWDPLTKTCTRLSPLSRDDVQSMKINKPETYDFIGPEISKCVAEGIACGKINPRTLEPFSTEATRQDQGNTPGGKGTVQDTTRTIMGSIRNLMLDTMARRQLFGMVHQQGEQRSVEEKGVEMQEGKPKPIAAMTDYSRGHQDQAPNTCQISLFDNKSYSRNAVEPSGLAKRARRSSLVAPPRPTAPTSESIRKFFGPYVSKFDLN